MPVTVAVNHMTVVHQASGGTVSFMPDVCLTPVPSGSPVPVPYPNLAMSRHTSQGSATVTCDGHPVMVKGSCFSQSTGDEAGSAGGVASHITKGKAEFIAYSFDVLFDGKPVARAMDLMLGNKGGAFNTPPAPLLQPPMPPDPDAPDEETEPDSLLIQLVDQAGEPIKDARYLLHRPDGTTEEGRTNAEGKIRVARTVAGVGRVVFPDHRTILTED
jgi:hypothetical protein